MLIHIIVWIYGFMKVAYFHQILVKESQEAYFFKFLCKRKNAHVKLLYYVSTPGVVWTVGEYSWMEHFFFLFGMSQMKHDENHLFLECLKWSMMNENHLCLITSNNIMIVFIDLFMVVEHLLINQSGSDDCHGSDITITWMTS